MFPINNEASDSPQFLDVALRGEPSVARVAVDARKLLHRVPQSFWRHRAGQWSNDLPNDFLWRRVGVMKGWKTWVGAEPTTPHLSPENLYADRSASDGRCVSPTSVSILGSWRS